MADDRPKRPKTRRKNRWEKELEEKLERLQADYDDQEKRLQKAVHDLAKANTDKKEALEQRHQFSLAAKRAKLQFDGTHAELKKVVQRLDEHRYHRDIAQAARDENAARWQEAREKIFELEHGIDERVAAAEGKAMFYKERLSKVLRAVDAAKEEPTV